MSTFKRPSTQAPPEPNSNCQRWEMFAMGTLLGQKDQRNKEKVIHLANKSFLHWIHVIRLKSIFYSFFLGEVNRDYEFSLKGRQCGIVEVFELPPLFSLFFPSWVLEHTGWFEFQVVSVNYVTVDNFLTFLGFWFFIYIMGILFTLYIVVKIRDTVCKIHNTVHGTRQTLSKL